jgi:hypothetical protein
MADEPTYYLTQTPEGAEIFHCLQCEAQGQEHHTTDAQLFAQHMAQRHDGRLAPAPAGYKPEEHPHGGPPGQDPTFVPPGQGGTPPGQEGTPETPAEGEEPHPEQLPSTPEPAPEAGA